jgi:hypothetical protein
MYYIKSHSTDRTEFNCSYTTFQFNYNTVILLLIFPYIDMDSGENLTTFLFHKIKKEIGKQQKHTLF